MTMLFLFLAMIVAPFLLGSAAALCMHYYRSRHPLPLLLPRWASTPYGTSSPLPPNPLVKPERSGLGKRPERLSPTARMTFGTR